MKSSSDVSALNLRFRPAERRTFHLFNRVMQWSICLSKADRKDVIHPGMKLLMAVSEHENWIQGDKTVCALNLFTADLTVRSREKQILIPHFIMRHADKCFIYCALKNHLFKPFVAVFPYHCYFFIRLLLFS